MAPGGPHSPAEIASLLWSVHPADILSADYLFRAPGQLDSIARGLGLGRFMLVDVDADADHAALVDDLSRLSCVESVDLNWRLELQWTPNDSLSGAQLAMCNTG